MKTTASRQPATVPSPCPVPIAPEVWIARRFRLPPATARVIAEIAFGSAHREARA